VTRCVVDGFGCVDDVFSCGEIEKNGTRLVPLHAQSESEVGDLEVCRFYGAPEAEVGEG